MQFYGYHGVLPEEKVLGQIFIIDLEMKTELKEAGVSDDLKKTVSYAEVFADIEKIVTLEEFDLIEALAEKIAERVLTAYPINKVKVRVKKPQAPIKGQFDFVAVEIKRG